MHEFTTHAHDLSVGLMYTVSTQFLSSYQVPGYTTINLPAVKIYWTDFTRLLTLVWPDWSLDGAAHQNLNWTNQKHASSNLVRSWNPISFFNNNNKAATVNTTLDINQCYISCQYKFILCWRNKTKHYLELIMLLRIIEARGLLIVAATIIICSEKAYSYVQPHHMDKLLSLPSPTLSLPSCKSTMNQAAKRCRSKRTSPILCLL